MSGHTGCLMSPSKTPPKPRTFGEWMRQRREELDISLDELSFRCRIGSRLLGAYERGENHPGEKNLSAIMRALEVELPWDADSGDSSTARQTSFPEWVTGSRAPDLVPAAASG